MTRYAALLRGINVGGRTRIAMADLRRLFADLGYDDAQTYLQSGNVVFTGPAKPSGAAGAIEQRISTDLGLSVTVLLRTARELAEVHAGNPFLEDADPAALHVTFLAEPPGKDRASGPEPPPGTKDAFRVSGREVYLHCPDGYGRSKLTNAWFEKKLGIAATTRNWRTVTSLRELAGG